MSGIACLLLSLTFVFRPLASAHVQLHRFYPPAICVGNKATVKAEGKFPNCPVKAVVNLSADAASGIVWVRLIDEMSAAKLVSLLIEPIATIEEIEPIQKIAEATALSLPTVVYRRLANSIRDLWLSLPAAKN